MTISIVWLGINSAYALCCFPYDSEGYVDPKTGFYVGVSELQNDSYFGLPFGNLKYTFEFLDKDQNVVLQKTFTISDDLPIKSGFVISPGQKLPFKVIVDDVNLSKKITSFQFAGTENLQYFKWKPADLIVKFDKITLDKQGTNYNTWKIQGTILNNHTQSTKNVYVLASIYQKAYSHIIGVAGYSKNDVQPVTLEGFETKDFALYADIPSNFTPDDVYLYAESDDSSMVDRYYTPIILREATKFEDRFTADPKKPITISANVTNISRNDLDFDWIVQIKKSPKSVSEGDLSKDAHSKVESIKKIQSHVKAQQSVLLEYSWTPQSNGIYFYEMYVWNNSIPLSFPSVWDFFSDHSLFVNSNLNSVTNQVKSGISLDQVQCKDNLRLAHKETNANLVCVKPESIPNLIKQGWLSSKGIPCEYSQQNCSQEIPLDLNTCDKVTELTMDVWHCPLITTPTKFELLETKGFGICEKNHNQYYVLESGKNGTFTYRVSRTTDFNHPPIAPEQVEIIKEPSFLCEYDNSTRKPCMPEGVHISYSPESKILGFNQSAIVSAKVYASDFVSDKTLWLGLTPYACGGGSYERFATIASDSQIQRELSLVSVWPKNVTLPDPKPIQSKGSGILTPQ